MIWMSSDVMAKLKPPALSMPLELLYDRRIFN